MAEKKRRSVTDEKRVFQEKWENMYFVSEIKGRILCLICQKTISVPKDYNVRRHYETLHREMYETITGKARDEKIKQLKAGFKQMRAMFENINKTSEDCVRVSYMISHKIASSSRPFTDGQFVKDCMLNASQILCNDKKKIFEGISLSANTVARRITDLSGNVYEQLKAAAKDFEVFSIALDESTDVTDVSQCAVFIRGVDRDLNVTEEFLDLLPLKGTTTGRDIFQQLEICIEKFELNWSKLVSIATDGAPAMCSENVGVVGLLKAKLNSLGILGSVTAIHCILHQEALCSKSLKMKEVMEIVIKTVNFLRSRALNHRQFREFLISNDSEYEEIPFHTEVRWLSRGKVLKRFFAMRQEIASFMEQKGKAVPALDDKVFVSNLAFLSDITDHLNMLNLNLQGADKLITGMHDSVKCFKMKLLLWKKQISTGNFINFPTLKSLADAVPNVLEDYADLLGNLITEFERRFKEFDSLEPKFAFFLSPFDTGVESVSDEMQMELIEFQCDSTIKQKYKEVGVPEFLKYVPRDRFPLLLHEFGKILAMFGSTFVCEKFFSEMKMTKSSFRSRLTDEHLTASLRLATTRAIEPNIEKLITDQRCQLSNQK